MQRNQGAEPVPAPDPEETPSGPAPAPARASARRGRRNRPARRTSSDTALSRELADFLVEFSIVLHKRSMYPAGHPQLEASGDRFVRRLDLLLAGRETVTLGVARHQLVIENVTTDPNNALLRALARRPHRHRIASVRLSVGTTLEEIDSVLAALSADPARGNGPLGRQLATLPPWPHIELQAAAFGNLVLEQDSEGDAEDAAADRKLWVELA